MVNNLFNFIQIINYSTVLDMGFGCVLVLNISELYLKLKTVYTGGDLNLVNKEIHRNWFLVGIFLALTFLVTVGFSIGIRLFYLDIDFEGSPLPNFSPIDVVRSMRKNILIPYGVLSGLALLLIYVPFWLYSKNLR